MLLPRPLLSPAGWSQGGLHPCQAQPWRAGVISQGHWIPCRGIHVLRQPWVVVPSPKWPDPGTRSPGRDKGQCWHPQGRQQVPANLPACRLFRERGGPRGARTIINTDCELPHPLGLGEGRKCTRVEGWATFPRAPGRPLPGKGLSAAPGDERLSCRPGSVSEASESTKFWVSPPLSVSLKSFPKTSISHICPAPLGLSDPPPKTNNKRKDRCK